MGYVVARVAGLGPDEEPPATAKEHAPMSDEEPKRKRRDDGPTRIIVLEVEDVGTLWIVNRIDEWVRKVAAEAGVKRGQVWTPEELGILTRSKMPKALAREVARTKRAFDAAVIVTTERPGLFDEPLPRWSSNAMAAKGAAVTVKTGSPL